MSDTDSIEGILVFITIVVVASVIIVSGFALLAPLWTQQTHIITITEKIPYHGGQYLVTVERMDGSTEVLSVSDEPILLKFDASDRYAQLKVGVKYSVRVCGYRFQLLSWYRNIYEINQAVVL